MKKPAKNTRGFTLVEVLVAMGVLAIGGLATLQLIGVLINSNHNISATTEATALGNRLVAEISDARFFSPANFDPGLIPGTYTDDPCPGLDLGNPGCASTIRTVGLFRPGNPLPVNANDVPQYRVTYQVVNCGTCQNVPGGGTGPGGVEVVVEVDNFRAGNGPLLRPIRMVLRREYSPVADNASVRAP